MKKIPSLFKRNYDGDRLVRDAVVEGSEWVLAGEGVATEQFDGTACLIRAGELFKRYDRKPSSSAKRKHIKGTLWKIGELKLAPEGWKPAEPKPNLHTGHWPGWILVGDGPEDQYHWEARLTNEYFENGTYELVGPKVQGNPYNLGSHVLWKHGEFRVGVARDFDSIRDFLENTEFEGLVWHHPDGRMAKIKRRDFGLEWPVTED